MTVILSNPRERIRFLRFAVVGIIGAVVDFGMMNLLVQVFAFRLTVAGVISFITAILSNFYWNRRWTYPDSRSKPLVKQLFVFAVVNTLGLAIRIPILMYLEPWLFGFFLRLPFELPIFEPDFYAKNFTLAVAVIIVMFWNFFINRYWTYNDVQ